MSEQKTMLPSLRNQNWKKVKVETQKVNKLLQHILTENIAKQNELIYAGSKLFSDKTDMLQRNRNRTAKPGCEMRRERQIKTRRYQAKLLKKVKHTTKKKKEPTEWKDSKRTTADKSDNTTGRNESKDIDERRETLKVREQGQTIKTKEDLSK